jgi:hypothetical protein
MAASDGIETSGVLELVLRLVEQLREVGRLVEGGRTPDNDAA